MRPPTRRHRARSQTAWGCRSFRCKRRRPRTEERKPPQSDRASCEGERRTTSRQSGTLYGAWLAPHVGRKEIAMKLTVLMPEVKSCGVAGCGYNVDASCHARAITVGDGDNPGC